jgi:hypothetical protein
MAATDTYATIEELLEAVFSARSMLYLRDATIEELLEVSTPCGGGPNTSTVARQVVGGEQKETQFLGV